MGTSDPVLRPARRSELSEILALLADDEFSRDREGGTDEAVVRAFADIEADPNSTMYVFEVKGAVVGCAQLTVIPGLARRGLKRGLIEAVRIDSARRNQGLGRRLIGALIEEAKRRGCGLVQLTSDKRRADAHRFYRTLGFAMSHEGFKLPLDGSR